MQASLTFTRNIVARTKKMKTFCARPTLGSSSSSILVTASLPCDFAHPNSRYTSLSLDCEPGHLICFGNGMLADVTQAEVWNVLVWLNLPFYALYTIRTNGLRKPSVFRGMTKLNMQLELSLIKFWWHLQRHSQMTCRHINKNKWLLF